jgi:hypothetical protein
LVGQEPAVVPFVVQRAAVTRRVRQSWVTSDPDDISVLATAVRGVRIVTRTP